MRSKGIFTISSCLMCIFASIQMGRFSTAYGKEFNYFFFSLRLYCCCRLLHSKSLFSSDSWLHSEDVNGAPFNLAILHVPKTLFECESINSQPKWISNTMQCTDSTVSRVCGGNREGGILQEDAKIEKGKKKRDDDETFFHIKSTYVFLTPYLHF